MTHDQPDVRNEDALLAAVLRRFLAPGPGRPYVSVINGTFTLDGEVYLTDDEIPLLLELEAKAESEDAESDA